MITQRVEACRLEPGRHNEEASKCARTAEESEGVVRHQVAGVAEEELSVRPPGFDLGFDSATRAPLPRSFATAPPPLADNQRRRLVHLPQRLLPVGGCRIWNQRIGNVLEESPGGHLEGDFGGGPNFGCRIDSGRRLRVESPPLPRLDANRAPA